MRKKILFVCYGDSTSPKAWSNVLNPLDHYSRGITKVGFALDISDIPDHYPPKNKVLEWERQFWNMEVEPEIYKSSLDTTFALYKPGYPQNFNNNTFLQGIRLAGNFTAKHGDWYINPENFTEKKLVLYKFL